MTTYFPAPDGSYDQVRARKLTLVPSAAQPVCNAANTGAMYYDQAKFKGYICNGTAWDSFGGRVWKQTPDGSFVYPAGLDGSPVVRANVGVGTLSPQAPLHIALPAAGNVGLLVKGVSGAAGVSVLSAATGVSGVNLGSVGSPGDGLISYNNANASRTMTFKTSAADAMTLKGTNLTVIGDLGANNIAATQGVTTASVTASGAVTGGSVSGINIAVATALTAANIKMNASGLGAASGVASLCYKTYATQMVACSGGQCVCPDNMVSTTYASASGGSIKCARMQLQTCSSWQSCTPVDCACSSWGDCDASCGPGTQTRTCMAAACGGSDAACVEGTSKACDLGACPPDCTDLCSGLTAVTVPLHATGVSQVCSLAATAPCGTSSVITSWNCDAGYHQVGNVCVQDCTPLCSALTAVAVPANAAGSSTTCSTMTTATCGNSSVVTAWSCNAGYYKSGESCVSECLDLCSGMTTVSSKPANAHYTATACSLLETDSPCSNSSVNTGWACDTGYHMNGANNGCDMDIVCFNFCSDVTIPANAHCISSPACSTSMLPPCDNATNCAAWGCNSGYTQSGSSCVCVPSCSGKNCGADGCGGSCGTCTSPQTCNAVGVCGCVSSCSCAASTCSGSTCDDGCGGTCAGTMKSAACGNLSYGAVCTQDSDCANGSCLTIYNDADKDGYGAAAAQKRCYASAPSGKSTDNTDCCDTDPRSFPGDTNYYPYKNNCGSWDWNCNGANDKFFTDTGTYCDAPAAVNGSYCDLVGCSRCTATTVSYCPSPGGFWDNGAVDCGGDRKACFWQDGFHRFSTSDCTGPELPNPMQRWRGTPPDFACIEKQHCR